MSWAFEFHRKIREAISGPALNSGVAADVNVVVTTGVGIAHAQQDSPITQIRRARPAVRSQSKETQ